MNGFMMNNNGGLMKDDMVPMRKSTNVTESVPVPSSEHVAEIVGRQGCKIKALRAKTNTYIKTPVRDEEPVFVVTGRKEDVVAAKSEIISAAEHFSQIRAARRPGGVGPGSPSIPGQMKLNVPVPYRVVGLLVGSKGATIKKIQQKTSTYIVTPSREKEPMFEVTGQEENVYQARALMYYHIFERTGQLCDPKAMGDIGMGQQGDFLTNINMSPEPQRSLPQQFSSIGAGGDSVFEDPMSALAALNSLNGAFMNASKTTDFNLQNAIKTMNMTRNLMNNNNNNMTTTTPSAAATSINQQHHHQVPDPSLQLPGQSLKPAVVDEGISLSPPLTSSTCFWSTDDGKGTSASSVLPHGSKPSCPLQQRKSSLLNNLNSFSLPQTFPVVPQSPSCVMSDKFTFPTTGYPTVTSSTQSRSMAGDLGYNSLSALTSALVPLTLSGSGGGANSAAESVAGSLVSTPDTSPLTGMSTNFMQDTLPSSKKYCLVCLKNPVTGAFLPCGHNHFCTECADLVLQKSEQDRKCPYCQEPAAQFFKIYT